MLENDYATAAVTADGTFGVVYVPTERTRQDRRVEAAARRDRALVRSRPTARPRPATAPFTTPGKNAAGDQDWVLVFVGPTTGEPRAERPAGARHQEIEALASSPGSSAHVSSGVPLPSRSATSTPIITE